MLTTDIAVLEVQHLRLSLRHALEYVHMLAPEVDLHPPDQLRQATALEVVVGQESDFA